jgi:hypothetical protein
MRRFLLNPSLQFIFYVKSSYVELKPNQRTRYYHTYNKPYRALFLSYSQRFLNPVRPFALRIAAASFFVFLKKDIAESLTLFFLQKRVTPLKIFFLSRVLKRSIPSLGFFLLVKLVCFGHWLFFVSVILGWRFLPAQDYYFKHLK